MPSGHIISIVNHKGGVGKTTTACNLAHALAREGKRVLVVDMDPQCNATSILRGDIEARCTLYEILDPEENEISIENCIYGTAYNDLYLIHNIPETATIEPRLIRLMPNSLTLLKAKIRNYAVNNFDFTIIDNPPNLGTFVICSLYCSDFVIVPNEAGSRYSVDGLIKAVNFVDDVQKDNNPNLRFLKLLITKVDRRMSVCKAIISQIRRYFPIEKVFDTMIPSNTEFQKAELSFKTVIAYKSNASGSIAYQKLAREILALLKGQ
ncbi:MAG: ParA family protein [Desulfobacca sp.]|nr:ParA family protein [Desulfobacca sp.]